MAMIAAIKVMTKKHSKKVVLTAATLGLCLVNSVALASAASTKLNTFTPQQKVAIEQIVHDYLVANPTVLIEATQALQIQQQRDMMTKATSSIKANAQALFNHDASPVIGNPKGSVTLIEFFDYQCSVCQRMAPVVKSLMKNNPNLRVVLKQWPIFGKVSADAAKAGLAAVKQNKFDAFYEALVMNTGHLTDGKILSIAKSTGLDTAQLEKDMKNPAFDTELKDNLKLAEALHLVGTPAFIIAKTPDGVYHDAKTYFVPGGASEDTLKELIEKAQG
jgi:protein-disulfide isomerase